MLKLTETLVQVMPNLDDVASQRGESLGAKFANAILLAVLSSKSDIRAAAESLLTTCVEKDALSINIVKRASSRMKPANQRALSPLLAKLAPAPAADEGGDGSEDKADKNAAKNTGRNPPAARARQQQKASANSKPTSAGPGAKTKSATSHST